MDTVSFTPCLLASFHFFAQLTGVFHEIDALVDYRLQLLPFLDFDFKIFNPSLKLLIDLSLDMFPVLFFLLRSFDDSTHCRVRLHHAVRLPDGVCDSFEQASLFSKPQRVKVI